MKKLINILMLLTLLLVPARSASALGSQMDGRVIIGQNFTLASGQTINGDLVVIGGEVTIENGATVQGDTVVIGGSLNVDGAITGQSVVIGGLLTLGSQASLAGDVVTVGGSLQRDPSARIGGNVITNLPPPTIPLPKGAVTQNPPVSPQPWTGVDLGPLGTAAGIFFQALGLGALAMLLTVFLHPQLDRVAQTVISQPFIAGSIGVLTVIFGAIAVVILAITLILIPVALAAVLLLVLAWLLGVVAFGMEVGDRFGRAIHRTWEPVLSAGFGTFLLAVVVGTFNIIPCVGWLAPVMVGLMGLGAAVITVFGTRPALRPGTPTPVPAPASGASGAPPIPPAT